MQSSSPEQQNGQDSRSARRRLIRGAFGAPAALTLYSGSALAATSLNCVQKRVRDGDPNPGTSTSATTDMFLRVQVYEKGNGSSRTTWVSGDALRLAASLSTGQASTVSFLGADGWYCLSAGNGSQNQSGYIAGTVYTNAGMLAINNVTPTPLANAFVAIRVNESGQIVGVTSTANASAVPRSCWTSFVRTI